MNRITKILLRLITLENKELNLYEWKQNHIGWNDDDFDEFKCYFYLTRGDPEHHLVACIDGCLLGCTVLEFDYEEDSILMGDIDTPYYRNECIAVCNGYCCTPRRIHADEVALYKIDVAKANEKLREDEFFKSSKSEKEPPSGFAVTMKKGEIF
jgi:hypothetical protein